MGIGARTKGYLKDLETGEIKKFIYNPGNFSTSRKTTYLEVSSPGSSYPIYQYANGTSEEISLDLYLRDAKGVEVKSYIDFLETLLPNKDSNSKFEKPHLVLFAFGEKIEKCILLDLSLDYTDWNDELSPIEANANLKMVVIK